MTTVTCPLVDTGSVTPYIYIGPFGRSGKGITGFPGQVREDNYRKSTLKSVLSCRSCLLKTLDSEVKTPQKAGQIYCNTKF